MIALAILASAPLLVDKRQIALNYLDEADRALNAARSFTCRDSSRERAVERMSEKLRRAEIHFEGKFQPFTETEKDERNPIVVIPFLDNCKKPDRWEATVAHFDRTLRWSRSKLKGE